MPGNIVPELPEDTFRMYAEGDEPSDWVEVLATAKPGGAGGFSLESSQDSLVITIPANKVRSALLNILGYSYSDDVAYELVRPAVPVQHPRYPWLFADGVSVQLQNPLGNTAFTYDSRRDERYTGSAARTQAYLQAKEDSQFGDNSGYMPAYMGRYGRAELTIRFSQVDWPIFRDGDEVWDSNYGPEFEYKRFFGMADFDPKLDLITAEGGTDASSFYFAETDDPAVDEGPDAGPSGSAFNGSVHVRKCQSDITMIWKTVAEDYTCLGGPTMPQPARLLAHLGTTNTDWFPGTEAEGGFPPHTLLFAGLKGKRYQLPASVDDATAVGAYCWDWYMTFTHFDPKRPDAVMDYGNVSIPDATRARGWRLLPWRNSRRWYAATAGDGVTRGTYSGNFPLPASTFANMFRHVSDGSVDYP